VTEVRCIFRLDENTTRLEFWASLQCFTMSTAAVLYSIAFGSGLANWQLVAVPPPYNQNMHRRHIICRNFQVVTVLCAYQLLPPAFGSLFSLLPCVDLGASGRRFMYKVTENCSLGSSAMAAYPLITVLGLAMALLCYTMYQMRETLRAVLQFRATLTSVAQNPRPAPRIRAPQWSLVRVFEEQCGDEIVAQVSAIIEVIERYSKGRSAPNEIRRTIMLAEVLLEQIEERRQGGLPCDESAQHARDFLSSLKEASAAFSILDDRDTERFDALTDPAAARTFYDYSLMAFLCDGYNPDTWYWEGLVMAARLLFWQSSTMHLLRSTTSGRLCCSLVSWYLLASSTLATGPSVTAPLIVWNQQASLRQL